MKSFLAEYKWTPVEKLTKDEINTLPLFQFNGDIQFVKTQKQQELALQDIVQYSVVGLDTETRPTFRKGTNYTPSLIQISTGENVYLFDLKQVGLIPAFDIFFQDVSVIKTGVAVKDDFRCLLKIRPFEYAGVADLADIAKANNVPHQGLRGLAAYFLGIRISKSEQCSNWGRAELTQKQIKYAATDAWVSLAIYHRMKELGLLNQSPASSSRKGTRKKQLPSQVLSDVIDSARAE